MKYEKINKCLNKNEKYETKLQFFFFNYIKNDIKNILIKMCLVLNSLFEYFFCINLKIWILAHSVILRYSNHRAILYRKNAVRMRTQFKNYEWSKFMKNLNSIASI